MGLWQSVLEKRTFHQLNDGRVVFYPYGPFRGYVIPDEECRSRIAARFSVLEALTLLGIVIELLIVFLLHLGLPAKMTIALFLVLFHWLCYVAVVRYETRGFLPLPFMLGFRFYAGTSNEKHLQRQFFQYLLCGALSVFIFGRQWFVFAAAAVCVYMSVIAGLLLYTRNNENRQPSDRTA